MIQNGKFVKVGNIACKILNWESPNSIPFYSDFLSIINLS